MSETLTNTISITEKAKGELVNLEVNLQTFLRLWVAPGGCQGMSYQAAIDDQWNEGDVVLFEDADIKVVSDADSSTYLPGLVIDYSDDLATTGFRFLNPNAKASCGCGSSFCSQ